MSTNVDLALVKGARDAAPKFTDIGGAVGKAVATGEAAFSAIRQEQRLQRFEQEREAAIARNADKLIGEIEVGGLPEEYASWGEEQAEWFANQKAWLVQNRKRLDPSEYLKKERALQKQLGTLQKGINNLSEYKANWLDIQNNEKLSAALTGEQRKLINDIVTNEMGTPVFEDGQMFLTTKSGEKINVNELPEIRSKAAVEHNEMEKDIGGLLTNYSKINPAAIKASPTMTDDFRQNLVASLLGKDIGIKELESMMIDFIGLGGKYGEVTAIYNNLKQGVKGALDVETFDKDGEEGLSDREYTAAMKDLFSKISDDGDGFSKDEFIKQAKMQYVGVAEKAWEIMHNNAKMAEENAAKAARSGKIDPNFTKYQDWQANIQTANNVANELGTVLGRLGKLQATETGLTWDNILEGGGNKDKLRFNNADLGTIKAIIESMSDVQEVYTDLGDENKSPGIRVDGTNKGVIKWEPKDGLPALVDQLQGFLIDEGVFKTGKARQVFETTIGKIRPLWMNEINKWRAGEGESTSLSIDQSPEDFILDNLINNN
jgi:hypothetical protein